MLSVETKKATNQMYYIGSDEDFLDKANDMMTLEDLHNDSRLIIIDNYLIFTDEHNLNEVMHNYELDFKQTLEEWWVINGAPGRYYNEVEGEIDHSNLASPREISDKCVEVLSNMSKEELANIDFSKMYVKCAKKIIIDHLRSEADRLERELT